MEVAEAFADRVTGTRCSLLSSPLLTTGPRVESIGAETTLSLANGNSAQVILGRRNESKIRPVIEQIEALNPNIKVTFLQLDLADQASIHKAASEINTSVEQIDYLINCAGVMAVPTFETTKDGIEMQFGFEHDVVRYEDWNCQNGKDYHPWGAYAQSKAINVLFSAALAEKLKNKGIQSYPVHPELILEANLSTHVTPETWNTAFEWANRNNKGDKQVPVAMETTKTLQDGCSTSLIAALTLPLKV
ncbi:hypothetical protein BGZ57DRAFT_937868 [Hyaloscypha finlandica]|nr:hypothetical protein BGZ57DRAFT_937868 [Hyaloscypha finlandica]